MPAGSDAESFFDGKQVVGAEVSSDSTPAEPQAAPEPGATPAVEAKAQAPADDDKEEEIPEDKAGLLKAIAAARGDKRKARAKWNEVEKALAEERKALEAERRDRARLEGELAALRKQGEPKPVQTPKPDWETQFWTSPEQAMREREQALEARFDARLQAQQQQWLQAERSRYIAQHADYVQAEAAFVKAAQANPELAARVNASADPFGFAYKTGSQLLRLQEYGEVNSIADLEAKIKERVTAELAGQKPPQPSAKPPIPTRSIASARGSSVGVEREWSGPRPAESFFTGPKI